MDEIENTSLERGASNDITRLRWRLKIRENIIARLVAENGRLRTLATHATPSEGSVQNGCRLTDEEREAVAYAVSELDHWTHGSEVIEIANTLRKLLERLGGDR